MPRGHALVISFAFLLGGCLPSSPAAIGGFKVEWSTKSPSLTVISSDGRTLLQTSGPLVESQTNKAEWQEMFGMFEVTENTTAWNQPTAMTLTSGSNKQLTFNVTQSGGHHSTIDISSPAASVLAITLTTDGQNRVRTGFACAATDHFLGFGSQTDAIDHYGHNLQIWTSEPGIGKTTMDQPSGPVWFLTGDRHTASYPLPTFLSNHGFAFLADTTHRSVFDLCQADPTRWTVENWDSSVTVKVYDGPAPTAAIERLTADIGRQPLANDLAFAPWNDAVFGSANVRLIASELRAAKIPSSVIWTEDFRGGTFNGDDYAITDEWDVDRTLYPDIETLASDLHKQGFRFLAYNNTFLSEGTKILPLAQAADVLIKQSDGTPYFFTNAAFVSASMVDLTNPAGVAFVKSWLTTIAGYGFDGWMSDYGEWLPADAKLFDGSNPEAIHNSYPKAVHQINAEVFASLTTDPSLRDYFVRSGTLRTAQYQPVVWGGDQLTLFDQLDGLPTALLKGLNLGLGGVAIYGHDIAGYQNSVNPPSTKELYFRWTELGALSPVMRTHHGTKAKLNWRFDTDADTTAHFARWSQFHAQLWPYLRSAAQEAFDHGQPIMRVLPLAFPSDASVWTISDEYLFGPSLLVAPVLIEGATSRNVYFPAGTWLPIDSGAPQVGPATVSVALPVTEIGLWAPAGSIIPMLPATFDTFMPADPPLITLAQVRNIRTLRVFGGANGTWTDIDGTTYTLTSTGNDSVISVSLPGGGPLPSCLAEILPCADVDATVRTATIQANAMKSVSFQTASSTSTLTVSGNLDVEKIVYRY